MRRFGFRLPRLEGLESRTLLHAGPVPGLEDAGLLDSRASQPAAEGEGALVAEGEGQLVADFSLRDTNPTSATFDQLVSPRDYLGQISGWYFGHAT